MFKTVTYFVVSLLGLRPSLPRGVLSCSYFMFPNYWGDVLNFLLKDLKFTFPTSLESAVTISEEILVGHISSCKSCSGEGGENGIHYVREKKSCHDYDTTDEGTHLSRALSSSPCLRAANSVNSYGMKYLNSPQISSGHPWPWECRLNRVTYCSGPTHFQCFPEVVFFLQDNLGVPWNLLSSGQSPLSSCGFVRRWRCSRRQ